MAKAKSLKDATDEEIAAELERRKRKADGPPAPLDNPDFGPVREVVIDGVERAAAEGYQDEDLKSHVYEAAVEAVYGKGFWDWRRRQRW